MTSERKRNITFAIGHVALIAALILSHMHGRRVAATNDRLLQLVKDQSETLQRLEQSDAALLAAATRLQQVCLANFL